MKQLIRSVGPYKVQMFLDDGWYTLAKGIELCGDAIFKASSEANSFYSVCEVRVVDKHYREVIKFLPGGKICHKGRKKRK